MRTRIISAFPGMGKSYYHKMHLETTLDSDSSIFHWCDNEDRSRCEKKLSPFWPNNYIQHIKENIGKYDFIFVSSHDYIRKLLVENCIFFYLIYPYIGRKDEFIKRFRDRGSPESFITKLDNNWGDWILECRKCEIGCANIESSRQNLSNDIEYIEFVEGRKHG